MKNSDLPIFQDWFDFLDRFFDITALFPKKVRFTFVARLENESLKILEEIVEARYAKKEEKGQILSRMNLRLEKMRVLLQLCHKRKLISHKNYEFTSRQIYQVGQQVGAWSKAVGGKNETTE